MKNVKIIKNTRAANKNIITSEIKNYILFMVTLGDTTNIKTKNMNFVVAHITINSKKFKTFQYFL